VIIFFWNGSVGFSWIKGY